MAAFIRPLASSEDQGESTWRKMGRREGRRGGEGGKEGKTACEKLVTSR